MKSFSSRLIPLAIASILCGVALAGAGKDDHTRMMEKMMDKHGDGKITATEYLQGEKELFSKIDTNMDGFITVQELEAYHQSRTHSQGNAPSRNESGTGKSMRGHMTPAQQIAKMDTDNDAKVSAAEWEAAARQRFSKMDKDGDGTLTAQELRDGERAMMASDE
jgi:Ca2+-binding EF-hand superfamily protein